MINAYDIASDFENSIPGCPYILGKSNPPHECDCSGAFVWSFRKRGYHIYHGSNTIYRQYCGAVGKIASINDLHVGMAVFKRRDDNKEPEKYRGDGHGNLYHIGLVTSTNPLRIVHATDPKGKVDTSVGKWGYYGWLDDVSYSNDNTDDDIVVDVTNNDGLDIEATITETVTAPPAQYFAVVSTSNGGAVNMRAEPSTECGLYKEVPNGETVQVIGKVINEGRTWSRVQRGSRKWYIASEYLRSL